MDGIKSNNATIMVNGMRNLGYQGGSKPSRALERSTNKTNKNAITISGKPMSGPASRATQPQSDGRTLITRRRMWSFPMSVNPRARTLPQSIPPKNERMIAPYANRLNVAVSTSLGGPKMTMATAPTNGITPAIPRNIGPKGIVNPPMLLIRFSVLTQTSRLLTPWLNSGDLGCEYQILRRILKVNVSFRHKRITALFPSLGIFTTWTNAVTDSSRRER